MCGWKVSVDDVLQRHGTPSQTGPASTLETIQDQQSSGGPSEKYHVLGQVRCGGLASTKRGGGEGGDERPRNDTAEIAPDEGLHLVEQFNSL
jgi:hypothetical protein